MPFAIEPWVERSDKWHYRVCYDAKGNVRCRVDVMEAKPGLWAVKLRRKSGPAIGYGTRSSQTAALDLATEKLKECGCEVVELCGVCRSR